MLAAPSRRAAVAVALLAACALALLACSTSSEHSVTGVITDVQATSLTQIESFTLHKGNGESVVLHVAPDASQDAQEGFFPGHLRSHALLAEQVTVYYRTEGDELLALRVEHAYTAPPASPGATPAA
jgi:hypothetical protein